MPPAVRSAAAVDVATLLLLLRLLFPAERGRGVRDRCILMLLALEVAVPNAASGPSPSSDKTGSRLTSAGKYLESSCEWRRGLNGGSIFFARSKSQSTDSKNGCLWMQTKKHNMHYNKSNARTRDESSITTQSSVASQRTLIYTMHAYPLCDIKCIT